MTPSIDSVIDLRPWETLGETVFSFFFRQWRFPGRWTVTGVYS